MAKRLYVASLPWVVDDKKLEELFAQFGAILSAMVIKDRETGRSRGFGFVEFEDDSAADEAIKQMNGADVEGRKIIVNVAKPRDN